MLWSLNKTFTVKQPNKDIEEIKCSDNSIENWDYMMQAIKEGKATLKEILLKGKELNALDNPAESVMLMEQAINKHFHPSNGSVSYLKDKHLQLDILPDN